MSRVPCSLDITSESGRPYKLLDLSADGVRLRGAPFDDAVLLRCKVGNFEVSFTVICVRQRPQDTEAELGAIITGDTGARSRLGYLTAALALIPSDQVKWLPFELLTPPKTAQGEMEGISLIQLPPLALRAVEASSAVHRRSDFVWRWALHAMSACTLSCVPHAQRDQAIELKLAYAILTTMVDDAADVLQNDEIFETLRKQVLVMASSPTPVLPAHAGAARTWSEMRRVLSTLPSFPALAPWLRFDHETVVHAMTHALLVNANPNARSTEEANSWGVRAFYMLAFADIDLMFAPDCDRLRSELGAVREILDHGQHMCAIANWIGTWEREFRQGDLSSGVASTALARKVFAADQLDELTDTISLVRQSHVEEYWMAHWEFHWHAIHRLPAVKTFDKASYVAGLERVYQLQMMGRGHL